MQGLPDSAATTLDDGRRSTSVTVTVHNSGDTAEAYFLDGRLDQVASVTLKPITPAANLTLPLSLLAAEPQWIVPTDTTSLARRRDVDRPDHVRLQPVQRRSRTSAPPSAATTPSATFTAPAGTLLTQGDWYIDPQRVGPFGSAGRRPVDDDADADRHHPGLRPGADLQYW